MISIVVPVYNEEEVLPSFIDTFFKEIGLKEKYELIFINDGSTDNTKNFIKNNIKKNKKIKLVSYDTNRGLGYAYRAGFNSSKGRIIVTMDSDLAHPPSIIPKLVKKIDKGYDVVVGSRYIPSGGIKGVPYHKDILSKLTNRFCGLFIGSNFKDFTSGLRAYNSRLLKKISTKENGFEVQLEIFLRLKKKRAKMTEIPFRSIDRQAGISKFNVIKQGMGYFIKLLKIIIRYRAL